MVVNRLWHRFTTLNVDNKLTGLSYDLPKERFMNSEKIQSFFDNVKDGDIIFTRGDEWTSKFIRFFTNSVINHCGVYYKGKVIESQLGYGVREVDINEYLNDDKTDL